MNDVLVEFPIVTVLLVRSMSPTIEKQVGRKTISFELKALPC